MIKGLEKVKGWSGEEIKSALEREDIRYWLEYSRNNWDRYFRDTRIRFSDESTNPIEVGRKLFGRPDRVFGPREHYSGIFYYATYRILPEFDMSRLNGDIRFENGLLVERTSLWHRNF